jgi:hypothetical protein
MGAMFQSHSQLLWEYRMALGLWSEVRVHYQESEPEVVAVAGYLDLLEDELVLAAR